MLHKFFEEGAWFRPKSYGYGAGLPIAWQGWALIAAHSALTLGVAFAFQGRPAILIPLVLFVAMAPLPIYASRTEGGWKWRSGDK